MGFNSGFKGLISGSLVTPAYAFVLDVRPSWEEDIAFWTRYHGNCKLVSSLLSSRPPRRLCCYYPYYLPSTTFRTSFPLFLL